MDDDMTLKGKRLVRKASDKGNQTYLRVPNTAQGRRFLEQLHKYAAMGVRITLRGRGSRRAAVEATGSSRKGKESIRRFSQDLPRHFAESFAVYLRKPAVERKWHEQANRSREYWVAKEAEKATAIANELARVRQALHVLKTV